jgi:outer membrane protein W
VKKFLTVLFTTAFATITAQLAGQAEGVKKDYVISNTSGFGIISKVGIANNISIRPFLNILGSSDNITAYLYGVSATYDFNILASALNPYAGVGYSGFSILSSSSSASMPSNMYAEAGADYRVSDAVSLNANYRLFANGGAFSLAANCRF